MNVPRCIRATPIGLLCATLAQTTIQFAIFSLECKLKFLYSHIKVAFGKFMFAFAECTKTMQFSKSIVVRSLAWLLEANACCVNICMIWFLLSRVCMYSFYCFASAAVIASSFFLHCRLSIFVYLLWWSAL